MSSAVNGDGSAALWALALLVSIWALWAGRGVFVPLVCALALAVLLSPLLSRIDRLLRLRKVAGIVLLGVAGALAGVLAVQAHPLVLAGDCDGCDVPKVHHFAGGPPQPGTVNGGLVDDTVFEAFRTPAGPEPTWSAWR